MARFLTREVMSDDRAAHPFETHLQDQTCFVCKKPAAHKIEETSGPDGFHPLTNWLCCEDFRKVMGGAHDGYLYDEPDAGVTPYG